MERVSARSGVGLYGMKYGSFVIEGLVLKVEGNGG